MAYQIIGLDRGTCAVKAVLLERTFRGYEVKGTRLVAVPQDGSGAPSREAIQLATQALVEEFDPAAVGFVTGYRAEQASTWFLQLPFTDQKRIDQALPFELEDHVPFDLDEMVLDYRVVRSGGGKARILAGLAPKEEVAATLSGLKALNVDPRALLLDGYALAYVPPGKDAGEQVLAIVDLGHTQTLVTVRRGNTPDFIRSIPLGGLQVTQAVMAAFGVDYPTAERMKVTLEAVPSSPAEAYLKLAPPVLEPGEMPESRALEDDLAEPASLPPLSEESLFTNPSLKLPELSLPTLDPALTTLPEVEEADATDGFTRKLDQLLSKVVDEAAVEWGAPAATRVESDEAAGDELAERTVILEAAQIVRTEPVSEARVPTRDEIEAVIWETLHPLIVAIRNALLAYEGSEHQDVAAVLLVGGGARQEGMSERLGEELGIPVGSPVRLGPDQLSLEEEAALSRYALGFALAYAGATDARLGELNFRRGVFAWQANYGKYRLAAMAGVFLLFVGLVVAVGAYLSSARDLRQQSAGLDTRISSSLKSGFPDVKVEPGKNLDMSIAIIQEQYSKLVERGKLLGVGVAPRRAIDLLKELSAVLPHREELKLDVDDFSYEKDQIKLRGTSDTFENIDKMKAAFETSPLVKEVKPDVSGKGDKKSFTVVVTLKSADELGAEPPKPAEGAAVPKTAGSGSGTAGAAVPSASATPGAVSSTPPGGAGASSPGSAVVPPGPPGAAEAAAAGVSSGGGESRPGGPPAGPATSAGGIPPGAFGGPAGAGGPAGMPPGMPPGMPGMVPTGVMTPPPALPRD